MKQFIQDFLKEEDDLGYWFPLTVIVAGICVILYWADKLS